MKVGIIGTGLMGLPMAEKLIEAGHDVIAYNRTLSKLEPLKAKGATLSESAAEVLKTTDCTILMLSDAGAIAAVLFNQDVEPALAGHTVIQMGTIAPGESQSIGNRVGKAGGDYLEAPVLGSTPQVRDRQLIVMVGGTDEQYQRWSGVLKSFGDQILHMGPVGTAAATKLAMNQLIGSLTTAFALSLSFVQREGIDVEKFMAIVRQSALYAPTFDKKLDRMVDRNFGDPNFPTKHLLKDMNLFAAAAQSVGIEAAPAEAVSHVIEKAMQMGLADADYSALFSAVSPADT